MVGPNTNDELGPTWRVFLVPVIAVFTKYDQFRRDIGFKLEDQKLDPALLDNEVEMIFKKEYLAELRESAPFVRLESEWEFCWPVSIFCDAEFCPAGMHKPSQKCTDLIEKTANELSGDIVAVMLMAIQKENLELSMKQAVRR